MRVEPNGRDGFKPVESPTLKDRGATGQIKVATSLERFIGRSIEIADVKLNKGSLIDYLNIELKKNDLPLLEKKMV